MDLWHILLVVVSIISTVAVGLNWIYFNNQRGIQGEIESIVKRLNECPKTCDKHAETTQGIFKVLDLDDKMDRIYRMMLYLIKKNYFHRHSEDSKSLIMADGLEEFIKDVTSNNNQN